MSHISEGTRLSVSTRSVPSSGVTSGSFESDTLEILFADKYAVAPERRWRRASHIAGKSRGTGDVPWRIAEAGRLRRPGGNRQPGTSEPVLTDRGKECVDASITSEKGRREAQSNPRRWLLASEVIIHLKELPKEQALSTLPHRVAQLEGCCGDRRGGGWNADELRPAGIEESFDETDRGIRLGPGLELGYRRLRHAGELSEPAL